MKRSEENYMNLAYEYSYSLKILNSITSQIMEDINITLGSISELIHVKENELNIDQIETSYQDLLTLKQQSMEIICSEHVDRQLIINMIASIVLIICEMINNLEQVKSVLKRMNMTKSDKVIISYELEYLDFLLTELIK
ncbi:hypothetical protein [Metabacillus litoralis]|uniref:hypothetical protein n=1 Tax=Metabacillus litoralis TaxID=152268 RepID=UPI001CFC5C27|nr:hypothetical protein [Metabacillus litoralis]